MSEFIGRGERIRTSGPCLPKTVLYQAELLPDRMRLRRRTPARQRRPYRDTLHALQACPKGSRRPFQKPFGNRVGNIAPADTGRSAVTVVAMPA